MKTLETLKNIKAKQYKIRFGITWYFTIIVSIMAIWGTLVAWENGFWHKLHHVVEHLHTEYTNSEVLNDVEKEVKKLE